MARTGAKHRGNQAGRGGGSTPGVSAVEAAIAALVAVAKKHPRTLREPEPTAHVVNFGDSGVEMELGFWISDPEHGTQNVRSDVSVALLSEFRSLGIEIPFPQREVTLLQGTIER